MSARERLAELIRERIGPRRGAQAELSRRLGERDEHWLSDRVTGKSAIKADELPRLARALGVPVSAFFEETSPDHEASLRSQKDAFLADLGFDVTPLERETIVEFVGALIRYRKRLLDEAG